MKLAKPIDIAESAPVAKRERYFARASGNGFKAFADHGAVIIELFDEIGPYGVTASDFSRSLADAQGGDVVLKLNSPGGSVFEGLSIYNSLVAHSGHVRVEVVGIAASIASIIAMAADELAMASNSFLMLHRAWGVTVGNEADHLEQAAVLTKIDKALAGTYATRTGKAAAEMHRLMNAETWLTAREAKAGGFADEVLGDLPIAARFDLGAYAKAPDALKAPVGPIQIQSRIELERLLRERVGLPKAAARKVAIGGFDALLQKDLEDTTDPLAVLSLIERLDTATAAISSKRK
jgi:ATP-dependent protease ClpP protease subunit